MSAESKRPGASPRSALSTRYSVLSESVRPHEEHRLLDLHGLAVLDEDLDDGAGDVGLLDEEVLHRLDHTDVGLVGDDPAADADERLFAGLGGRVEGADHRALNREEAGFLSSLGRASYRGRL